MNITNNQVGSMRPVMWAVATMFAQLAALLAFLAASQQYALISLAIEASEAMDKGVVLESFADLPGFAGVSLRLKLAGIVFVLAMTAVLAQFWSRMASVTRLLSIFLHAATAGLLLS